MFSDPRVEHAHQAGRTFLLHLLESSTVVAVDGLPLLGARGQARGLLVDEIAAGAVAAVALLGEGVASLGLIGSIMFHVDPQLLRAVRELALGAVGAEALLHEVFAEGALGLGAGGAEGQGVPSTGEHLPPEVNVLALGGGLGLEVEGRRERALQDSRGLTHLSL